MNFFSDGEGDTANKKVVWQLQFNAQPIRKLKLLPIKWVEVNNINQVSGHQLGAPRRRVIKTRVLANS